MNDSVKRKYLVSIPAVIVFFVFFIVFVFFLLESMQKDTCKKTIEFSIAVLINRNEFTLETPPDNNWRELNTSERKRFFEYVTANKNVYTECGAYPELLKEQKTDGSELPVSVRKNNAGYAEVLLGK